MKKTERMTTAEYRTKCAAPKKRNKYNAQRTEFRGRMYDSIKEANYARDLLIREQAGGILAWIPQVSIPVADNMVERHIVDFLVIHNNGRYEWVDVKGMDTPMSKRKRAAVKANYGIEVTII